LKAGSRIRKDLLYQYQQPDPAGDEVMIKNASQGEKRIECDAAHGNYTGEGVLPKHFA
jgi:hypothetical protein